jgi:hypothetical protein
MPQCETDHLIGYLFDGEDGASMVQRIDRRLSGLPGLDALALVASARRRTVDLAA